MPEQQDPSFESAKQVETHVIIRLFFILFWSRFGGLGFTSARCVSGSWCRTSIFFRIFDPVLQLLDAFPLVFRLDRDGQYLFVAIDNRMNDRNHSRVVDGKRDAGDRADGGAKRFQQLRFLNVQNFRVKDLAVIVDLRDTHAVSERGDVQHVEQGSLGGSDLVSSSNEFEIGGDFDGTTSNFGRNTKGLEERRLARFHTSVASGNPDVVWSDSASSSGSCNTVLQDLLTNFLKVAVGEDEADIA
jgi:hypothetical protein